MQWDYGNCELRRNQFFSYSPHGRAIGAENLVAHINFTALLTSKSTVITSAVCTNTIACLIALEQTLKETTTARVETVLPLVDRITTATQMGPTTTKTQTGLLTMQTHRLVLLNTRLLLETLVWAVNLPPLLLERNDSSVNAFTKQGSFLIVKG